MDNLVYLAENAAKRLRFQFPYDITSWVNDKRLFMENYHKHTTWSDFFQIDSATSIPEFMQVNEQRGSGLYFSGEHGYPGEWLYCYDLCRQTENEDARKKMGLANPVRFRYSAEVYWVKDINYERTETYLDKKGKEKTRTVRDNSNCHMVIVAKNYQAIRKLNYLISLANTDGFYYKPRIDLTMLFTLTPDDVYITSACIAGWKYPDAEDIWLKIWKHFGDSFFLEYQAHDTDKQKDLNQEIYRMSLKYGIQTIIGLDTHYISQEDCIKRDNLLKRKGLHYDDEEGWYMDYPDGMETFQRMKSQGVIPDEEIIYAMMNTHVFLHGCEELTYDTGFKIPVLPEYKNYSYEERAEELHKLLLKKYAQEEVQTDDRKSGLEYEFGEYRDSMTADYPLTNQKLVDLAINKYGGQLTTTSRGSASSYYSNKLLGFTTMDRFDAEVPVYPERFITKERILESHQMPDLDLNVSAQEPFVLAGREICGEHGCYPLLAVGKFGEKSGFKMYADIMGIEPSLANDITSAIDEYNEALKNVEDDIDREQIHISDYITDPYYQKVFDESKPYQGIIEQARVHACGHALFNGNPRHSNVIGYGDLRYEIGLIRCYSERTGKSSIVLNVEGTLLDSYGYCKDDFLIVDVVSIIYKLYHALGRDVPTVGELREMVSGDQATWDLYANGVTCCLNQCEKPGTTRKVKQYKPQTIQELSAFIAGIRPGFKSLINGFIQRISYSTGERVIDNLLKDSFHYMLYQEAVMTIFSYLGIPMKDSYDTIKKISKKKLKGEALQHVEETLREHWLNNIGNTKNFNNIYKVIKDSSRYSFNAPHALSMANDSLYEAWMKAHYTSIFYEVTMNHYQDKGNKNKVAELQHEAMQVYGYQMGSYQYGQDHTRIVIDDEKKMIYPSLASIKGIGDKALADLNHLYELGINDFVNLYLSITGTKINATVFRNLIKINYFRQYGSIKKLLLAVDIIDQWKSSAGPRKTIPKADVSNLSIPESTLRKYCTDISEKTGKVSDKQYRIIDWEGLMHELFNALPDDEYYLKDLLKFQQDVLGYVEFKDDSFDLRLVLVTDLKTDKGSPNFNAYCLKNGSVAKFQIRKTRRSCWQDNEIKVTFEDLPIQNGDIIYLTKCKKKPKQRKNAQTGKWESVPGEFVWWVYDYRIVNL